MFVPCNDRVVASCEDECAKCTIEQECKATCYLNQEEKRISLTPEKQRSDLHRFDVSH